MDLLDLPENPIPPGTVLVPVKTDDGLTIRAARFPATVAARQGTVVIFQGRGEQIEKYFRIVERLRRRGFAVVAFDWRGQGGSSRQLGNPQKGHVARFRHYERDVEAVRRQVALPDCPPPFYGLGHSMGGHILLAASPRLVPWLQRMVLTAPMLDFGDRFPSRDEIRRAAGLACALGFGRLQAPGQPRRTPSDMPFDGNPLTSDPAVFRMMMDVTGLRPDLGVGAPTMRWLFEAARSMDAMDRPDFPASVPIPVLMFNCGGDHLVSVRAIERMARRLRSVGYVLVPGARHELLQEREIFAAQFWAAFDAFVPGTAVV